MDNTTLNKIIRDDDRSDRRARLIPIGKDSNKEARSTSALLATFMVVPTYAEKVLSTIGVSVTKRTKISCYTEISFNSKDKNNSKDKKDLRPDGLIILRTGSKKWSAIVESKIGNEKLNQKQLEEYIDIAKLHGIDALITISNQFATVPSHHPIQIQKSKLRSIQIFHFSWLFLESTAMLLNDNKSVTDTEQAYILSELIRYFQHEQSGVTPFTRMGAGWKEVCQQVQEVHKLKVSDIDVLNTIGSWQQLLRYISIKLSVDVGKSVSIYLTKSRVDDPSLSVKNDLDELVKYNTLSAEFDIPNATSRLKLLVDLRRRTVSISMHISAPKDKKLASASINWLLRQLDHLKDSDLILTVDWPKRIPDSSNKLSTVFENPECLVPQGVRETPNTFEIKKVYDLASKFKGAEIFVDIVSNALPQFYEEVGQHITKWVPKPPKVKKVSTVETDQDKQDIVNPFWVPPKSELL